MLSLPLLSDVWISLSRGDFVVESQQALLPLSLRTSGDKRTLGIVVHQRIWKRGGDASTGNVIEPGSMPIFAWLLKVEDEEHPIIRVFKSYTIFIEDLGGKLMRITGQILEEHHGDLIPMGLHLV
jgi:hypothetical protein